MINDIITCILSFIPVIIILIYVYHNDKVEKEPIPLLLVLFISGIVSCFSILALQNVLNSVFPFLKKSYSDMNIYEIIFKSLSIVAALEEIIKWVANYMITRKDKNFNYIYDSIVYCVCVSLGFAFIETITYTSSYESNKVIILILRGIISIPCHAVFGIIMGYFIGIAKYYKSKKYLLLSILIPTIMHFIYDMSLVKQNSATSIMFIIFVITSYICSYFIIKNISIDKNKLD